MQLNSEAAQTFIEVEVSTAELFVDLALDAREDSARERHLGVASKAYGAARRFLPLTDFRKTTREQLERRLAEVQLKLEGFGEYAN
jgi:hypothetical protein